MSIKLLSEIEPNWIRRNKLEDQTYSNREWKTWINEVKTENDFIRIELTKTLTTESRKSWI